MPELDFIVFLIVFAIILVELFLSFFWVPIYYRHGIRIFYKRINASGPYMPLVNDKELSKELKGGWGPSLVFKSISSTETAFREKAFQFRIFNSTPIMHGLIRFSQHDRQIEVIGHLNWFILTFTLIALSTLFGMHDAVFIIFFFVVVFLLCFLFQVARYNKLVQVLEQKYHGVA